MRKWEFRDKIASIALGNALGQVVNLLSIPLIARLYTPEQMGEFSIAFSIAFIASQVGGLNFEKALLSAEWDEIPYLIVLFYLSLAGLLVFGGSVVTIVCGTGLVALGTSGNTIALLSALLFGLLSLQALARSVSVKNNCLVRAGMSRFCEVFTDQLVKIMLALASLASAAGLIVGSIMGSVMGGGVAFDRLLFSITRQHADWAALKDVARKYYQYPVFSTVNILLNLVSRYSAHGLLAIYYGFSVVGVYALAERMVMQPMLMFADAVRNITLSSTQMSATELKEQLIKTTLVLFGLGGLFVVFICIFSKQLIAIAFSDKWEGAEQFLVLLSFWVLFLFSNSMSLFVFELCGRQELKTKILICQFLARTIVLFVGCSFGLSVYSVLLAFVIVNIVLELGKFMFSYKLIDSWGGYAS